MRVKPQAKKQVADAPPGTAAQQDDPRAQAAARVGRKRKLQHLLNTALLPHGVYIYSRTVMHEATQLHGIIGINATVADAERWPDAPPEPPHKFVRGEHPAVCDRCGLGQEEHTL